MRFALTLLLTTHLAVAQVNITAERLSSEPLLSPATARYDANGVFNAAAVRHNGKVVLLYREQDANGTSRIGYAESSDGLHFTRRSEPVLSPEAPYERDGGLEDPRVVKIGDTFYLTYTGYNKKDAQLCLAISKDLIHWQRKGVIFPAYNGRWNVGWTKSGAILPDKINGKYWMYFMGTGPDKRDYMGVAWSADLLHWSEPENLDRPVLTRDPNGFDSRVMEPGPPPILTEKGILLIYNGAAPIWQLANARSNEPKRAQRLTMQPRANSETAAQDEKLIYQISWLLFDRNDPTRLLARGTQPFFKPELEWEKKGQVDNVVFVEGMVPDGKDWLAYYGAADKYIGAVRLKISY